MRTTVTLDADTAALLRQRMKAQRQSFKQVLNDAIRVGLGSTARQPEFRTEVAALGVPTVNLDRALQVVGELEDDELIRRMRQRS